MNNRSLSFLAGLTLVLGGCSLAPLYSRPPAPVPDQWPQGESYRSPSADADDAGLKAREFYADQRLRQVIALALANNRDLRLAALNLERVRALYNIQRAELWPALAATGAGSRQRLSADLIKPGESRSREQYSLELGVAAWELDFFGRVRSLGDQALESYLATAEARRGTRIALVSEVAAVYLTLAADREKLQLAQATLDNQQAAVAMVEKLFEVGLGTELDLHRARVPVETARGDVARLRQLVAQDRHSLDLLAGTTVAEELLPTDLAGVTPPREISPGLSSEALLRRPDLLAAEHQLRGAYAFIGAARAAFFPRISLTAALGTASDELSGLFGSGTDTWNFAPRIVMPIFDSRVWAAYRVSQADRDIALARYEKTIQTAFREVADALAVQGSIDQQLAAQQALVDELAAAHRLAEERFRLGLDGYLGVLDAQRSLYAAEQGLVTLRLAKLANRLRLYAALGGDGPEEEGGTGGELPEGREP